MPGHTNDAKWKRLRKVILVRDEYTCAWCGGEATQADHVMPRVNGGTDDPGNLVAACSTCNQRRGQATAQQRRRQRQRLAKPATPVTPPNRPLGSAPDPAPFVPGRLWKVAHGMEPDA